MDWMSSFLGFFFHSLWTRRQVNSTTATTMRHKTMWIKPLLLLQEQETSNQPTNQPTLFPSFSMLRREGAFIAFVSRRPTKRTHSGWIDGLTRSGDVMRNSNTQKINLLFFIDIRLSRQPPVGCTLRWTDTEECGGTCVLFFSIPISLSSSNVASSWAH